MPETAAERWLRTQLATLEDREPGVVVELPDNGRGDAPPALGPMARALAARECAVCHGPFVARGAALVEAIVDVQGRVFCAACGVTHAESPRSFVGWRPEAADAIQTTLAHEGG